MRVYHPEGSNMLVMVTPGKDHRDVSDWKDDEGKPKRFDVQFTEGVASVDDKLGKYMIEKGLAQRTALKRVTRGIKRAFA